MKSRRKTIERNLTLCFPKMSVQEREQLVKENIDNTGLALFETGMAWFCSDARVAKHVTIKGMEHIDKLAAEGRGALLVAVHSLNLELGARAFGLHIPGMGVYRPNNNPCFDYFQYQGRSRGGHALIDRKNIKFMLESLNNGERLWYAPDHDYGSRRSTFAPLFAVENACTTTGTSLLVDGSDCAIVPLMMVRNNDNGDYTLTIKAQLINQFPKHDPEAGVRFINKIVKTSIMEALGHICGYIALRLVQRVKPRYIKHRRINQTRRRSFLRLVCYTNQYKDLIAQREFSASEARQRVRNIVELGSSSLTLHQMC